MNGSLYVTSPTAGSTKGVLIREMIEQQKEAWRSTADQAWSAIAALETANREIETILRTS